MKSQLLNFSIDSNLKSQLYLLKKKKKNTFCFDLTLPNPTTAVQLYGTLSVTHQRSKRPLPLPQNANYSYRYVEIWNPSILVYSVITLITFSILTIIFSFTYISTLLTIILILRTYILLFYIRPARSPVTMPLWLVASAP
jgi:hypothetical protein